MRAVARWPIVVAAVLVALVAVAVASWLLLPRWCPAQVVRWSPWVDPAFRAVVADADCWSEWVDRVQAWGPAATPVLLRGLSSPDVQARMRSSASIAETRDRRAVPALIAALDDSDGSVRDYAVHALGGLRDPRGFDPLLARFEDPRCPERVACGYQLGFFRDARAIDPLIAGLADPDPQVRNGSVCSLRELRDARAIEALVAAAADAADYVRYNVQQALAELPATPEQRRRADENCSRGIAAERAAQAQRGAAERTPAP